MSAKTVILESVLADHSFRDQAWIEENAEMVYNAMAASLKDPQTVHLAVESLVLLFPHLLKREDLKRWGRLVKDIHKSVIAMPTKANPNPDNVEQIYTLVHREVRIRPTKRRRRERVHIQDIGEAYLLLLMSHVYHKNDRLDQYFITDLLNFSRFLNDAIFYHKIYQTLAFIYNRLRHFEKAVDYAMLSYAYWNAIEAEDESAFVEKGLTAYALADAYNGLGQHDEAMVWVEVASSMFANTDYKPQYAAIAASKGCTHLWLREYEEAAQWFELAVKENSMLEDSPNQEKNVAYYTLYSGIAHIYIGDYENAGTKLDQSMRLFEEIAAEDMMIHNQHAFAFLHAHLGEFDQSIERLNDLDARLAMYPEGEYRSFWQEKTNELRQAVDQRDVAFIRGLTP